MSDKSEAKLPQPNLFEEGGGCAAKEPYALRVLGDSMEPEFPDGCVIIIEPAGTAEIGNYVIAELTDTGFIFRQLTTKNGAYFLTPVNEQYEAISIEGLDTIRGVIVQKAGTRSHHRKHYL